MNWSALPRTSDEGSKLYRITWYTRRGADWRHLANTIKPSVCGSDAALCQITLTLSTCWHSGWHDDRPSKHWVCA